MVNINAMPFTVKVKPSLWKTRKETEKDKKDKITNIRKTFGFRFPLIRQRQGGKKDGEQRQKHICKFLSFSCPCWWTSLAELSHGLQKVREEIQDWYNRNTEITDKYITEMQKYKFGKKPYLVLFMGCQRSTSMIKSLFYFIMALLILVDTQ